MSLTPRFSDEPPALSRLILRDVVVPCTLATVGAGLRPPVGASRRTCAGCDAPVWLPAGSAHAAERVAARVVSVCFGCLQPVVARLSAAA
ncbi:MAG: hypothetical protein ACTHMZ_05805 [Actinomycetes bacterium]